jgi:hypothetical protein
MTSRKGQHTYPPPIDHLRRVPTRRRPLLRANPAALVRFRAAIPSLASVLVPLSSDLARADRCIPDLVYSQNTLGGAANGRDRISLGETNKTTLAWQVDYPAGLAYFLEIRVQHFFSMPVCRLESQLILSLNKTRRPTVSETIK